jgi:hypothetical protein
MKDTTSPNSQPTDEEQSFRRWRRRLGYLIESWEVNNRDQGDLLRGAPLAEAEGWTETHAEDLTKRECEFLLLDDRPFLLDPERDRHPYSRLNKCRRCLTTSGDEYSGCHACDLGHFIFYRHCARMAPSPATKRMPNSIRPDPRTPRATSPGSTGASVETARKGRMAAAKLPATMYFR